MALGLLMGIFLGNVTSMRADAPKSVESVQYFRVLLDQSNMNENSEGQWVVSRTISLEYRGEGLVEMELLNEQGQKIARRVLDSQEDIFTRSHIPVNRWGDGNYTLLIHIEGESYSYPIQITR